MTEATIKKRRLYQVKAFPNCYALAAALGFPFIDSGTSREDENGNLLGRFTNDAARLGPAIWVGVASNQRHLVVEDEA